MTRKTFRIIIAVIFVCVALGIVGLLVFPTPWNQQEPEDDPQSRIIIPESVDFEELIGDSLNESVAREDELNVKVPLNEGEILVSVLTEDFDGDQLDEQFVAYRTLVEIENPVYLAYVDSDGARGTYRQVWSAATAATRPGTVSVYTQDLTGDRNLCVLVAGMNGNGEHTLTAFKKNMALGGGTGAPLFTKIAELSIDGSIQVRETARSQAYQMGVATGVSFPIAAYGRDYDSENLMDQLEFIYTYNAGSGRYEQSRITKVPGIRIEQRRVQELLGNRQAFEDFISGLWYYVGAQGTVDSRQYIYFDPPNREIIFYGDETQQVFTWQNSSASRFGLHIVSQNISVTTLRRSIDIELESLESIKVKVFEDVRLKLGVNAPWDGSYRKAEPLQNRDNRSGVDNTYISAVYDSPAGRFNFSADGNYEIFSGAAVRHGKYAFFSLGNEEILELRPTAGPSGALDDNARETYLVIPDTPDEAGTSVQASVVVSAQTDTTDSGAYMDLRKTFSLEKIRLGVRGIERLHEGTITLTLLEE